MKKKLFIIFIISILNSKAQELVIHKLLPPNSEKHTDLHFLNKELEGKRIVMLGEMTHGYGNIFEMKIRVIEYLHEKLGYNTIAMESPMYGIWLMNKKTGFTAKEFNKSIFEVWSGTTEFQRLVKYIEKNNIKVIGFDSQVNNSIQFIDDFFDYCNKQDIKISLKKEDMGIIMEGVLNVVQYESYDINFLDFEKELNSIINQINNLKKTDNNYSWKQFTKGLLACTRDAYYNTKDILSPFYINSQLNYRDTQMADNLLSYIERNKEEKIICWADNIHFINDISSIKKSVKNGFVPMGSHIKKALGKDVYSLATIHANDSLLDNGTKIWHKTPILKPSFEHTLQSFNTPYLFVSSNQERMKTVQKHRLLSYSDFTEGKLGQLFDGYIFLNNATRPKNEANSISNNALNTSSNKSLPKNKKIRISYLKGQVLDAETNTPVAFANIILKSKAIYRVADENGYFKFPKKKEISANTLVTISSMGYSSKVIPLDKLNSKIKLKPNFETLDEVVIRGHLSPKVVLKKVIEKIKENHPTTPFNSKVYTQFIRYQDDKIIQDIEYIALEYNQGYRQSYISLFDFKQLRKNLTIDKKHIKQLVSIGGRENPIQYANILHKRKYKKFKLKFVKSTISKEDDLYIITFETARNKWNYTNRSYPTLYSGKIFINKDNFAIVKISEKWETTLNKKEIKKYKFWLGANVVYNDFKEITIKEESISTYLNIHDDKYYLDKILDTAYIETIDSNNNLENSVYKSKSLFSDINTQNVKVIEYKDYLKNKKNLKGIKFNKEFWESFDKNQKINLLNRK